MDLMNFFESILRWFHVVFGILWIGLLYFLNFVNSAFEATLDAESKRTVIPELRGRVLFWFRWGAAITWITGALLLLTIYYYGRVALPSPDVSFRRSSFGVLVFVVLVAPFIYDALVRSVLKKLPVAFFVGVLLVTVLTFAFESIGGFGVRGYAIHLGATFGTIMAFNVWFRIWPAQRKIISAIKDGQTPDAALVALAGLRSRHNTYLSVPLVFTMLNQHSLGWATNPIHFAAAVLVGWVLVYLLYHRAAQVEGF